MVVEGLVSLSAFSKRTDGSDVGASGDAILAGWLFFQIAAGHVGLPILVAVFSFSNKARRHPTLTNMCITWIISGVCSCFLLYAGRHRGPEPSPQLCLTQASLLYGVPPMTAMSTFALVFQIFMGVHATADEKADPRDKTLRTAALLVLPYIALGGFSTAGAWIGVHNPDKVNRFRRFFYCSIENSYLSNTISVFVALVLITTISLQLWIGVILHRNWRAFRATNSPSSLDMNMIGRVAFFGIYVFIGLVLSILSITSPRSPVPDFWIASVGLVVVLIFGSQKDVFRALLFWRKEGSGTRLKSGTDKTSV